MFKKSLIVLMMTLLLGMLVSCASVPDTPEWDIPDITAARPVRPTLKVIPKDLPDAVVVYGINLTYMMSYAEQLESYATSVEDNRNKIIEIITR